jgi:hypothetical protein
LRYGIALAAFTCATLLTGCSGLSVHRVSVAGDKREHGFRYYESAPYVLVYSDGKTGLTANIIYLPDLDRKMAAKPYNFIASNTTKLNFAHGVLTDSAQKGDGTTLPKALIEAVKAGAVAAAKGAALNQPEREGGVPGYPVPAPYLYKVVFDEDGVYLKGGQGEVNGRPTIQVVKFAETKS